jgi:hypothetical protein
MSLGRNRVILVVIGIGQRLDMIFVGDSSIAMNLARMRCNAMTLL